ncbi:MAG: carboxylate-amine ligase [Gammaproteobacteria bacterium]
MITPREPSFSIGVEEEYLLVDRETRDLCADPPPSLMQECEELLQGQVSPEFLRAQIEIGTRVCSNIQEVRADLTRLRSAVVEVSNRHGLAPLAASTHPYARWLDQKHTERERYDSLSSEMQAAARRLLICGMHVHIGIDDDELRIDLMNQFSYFLPHLLALSCSSPFWEGEDTGLKSYRLTVFDALPRTGLPERFVSYAEYRRHVGVMINAGLIQDATKIWWDLRPSDRYPTLEMRVTDVCTRLEDGVTLAALTVSLMRMLYRLRCANRRWRMYSPMLLMENRWRAMRYSFDEGMVDLAKGEIIPYPQLVEELIEIVSEDAEELGCLPEVLRARDMLKGGTSAHKQIRAYGQALEEGASEHEALQAVVDFLIAETARID